MSDRAAVLDLPPALAAGARSAVRIDADGEIATLDQAEAAALFGQMPHLICHLAFTARRLGAAQPPRTRAHWDVLELFAFARPAQACAPSPAGLARALGLPAPHGLEDAAAALPAIARKLLQELADGRTPLVAQARRAAATMARAGWAWGPAVADALGAPSEGAGDGLDIWTWLPEWEERAPPGQPGSRPVSAEEARARLEALRGPFGETRPAQADYAAAAARAFAPRARAGQPELVLAEAGTGIGKTLGYLAPAAAWAERNGPGLWISTYTRNLQSQIDRELARLWPDPEERAAKAVLRKGRENYLCLLNYEDAVRGTALAAGYETVLLGLVARWAVASRDGAMAGGDFPSWLSPAFGGGRLTDQRGECVYGACRHYRRCTIERSVRAARHAPVVIANHALVMTQAARERVSGAAEEDGGKDARVRYVFDEGHHVFDAADSAFAAHLSGQETAELRRWIRGPEGGRMRSRARGLRDRAADLAAGDEQAEHALESAVGAAAALPGDGWLARLQAGTPRGPAEQFLAALRDQVHARQTAGRTPYSLECEVHPLADGVVGAARTLDAALERLQTPLAKLAERIRKRLENKPGDDLDAGTRARIEATSRGLLRRAQLVVPAWRAMLAALASATPPEFADWFEIVRIDGREMDVGLFRHWIDPTEPFAKVVLGPAHGALITSATLRDRPPPDESAADESWQSAELRTGAAHLPLPALRASFDSPFDYAAQTRVLVVTDAPRSDPAARAGAYRALFREAGGGAVGLFTSVQALRAVHAHLAHALEDDGLTLYAQHADAMDTSALIDLFRAEEDACLLGTDAVRDGVDVPGRSLRLLVFDGVPWPRPDILHKARRARFGRSYDDMLTRLRIKQAYGRLIRQASDRGVFVMLENRAPTRLFSALPAGPQVQRVTLAAAVAQVGAFLHPAAPALAASAANL